MIDRSQIRGIVPPMLTPFQADGATVHETGVHQLVEFLLDAGAHGLFPGGTTGEVWALDDAQWERLVRFTVEAAAGRAPVYAGVSHPATAGAMARAKVAERVGADVVVSLAPYYAPPGQADIVRHFRALAEATALPVLVYQFPGIVKASISIPTYLELANIPGVVGVKDSLADATEFRHMIHALRAHDRDFRLFLGTDVLVDAAVLMGGQGAVPSMANLACRPLVETYEAAVAGDWTRANTAQLRALELKGIYNLIESESIFDRLTASLKGALTLLGIEVGPPAAPLRPATATEMRAIEEFLLRYDFALPARPAASAVGV